MINSYLIHNKNSLIDFYGIDRPESYQASSKLIIKDIINPMKVERSSEVTDNEIKLLKEWKKFWDSDGECDRVSLWGNLEPLWALGKLSDRDPAWDLIRKLLWNSLWDSFWDSVIELFNDETWGDIWEGLYGSVIGAFYGYMCSFFYIKSWIGFKHLPEYQNPFQSGIDLWDVGLVPSFDGKTWRLHSGENAEVVYEIEG